MVFGNAHCPTCGKETGCVMGQCDDCSNASELRRAVLFPKDGVKPSIRVSIDPFGVSHFELVKGKTEVERFMHLAEREVANMHPSEML